MVSSNTAGHGDHLRTGICCTKGVGGILQVAAFVWNRSGQRFSIVISRIRDDFWHYRHWIEKIVNVQFDFDRCGRCSILVAECCCSNPACVYCNYWYFSSPPTPVMLLAVPFLTINQPPFHPPRCPASSAHFPQLVTIWRDVGWRKTTEARRRETWGLFQQGRCREQAWYPEGRNRQWKRWPRSLSMSRQTLHELRFLRPQLQVELLLTTQRASGPRSPETGQHKFTVVRNKDYTDNLTFCDLAHLL